MLWNNAMKIAASCMVTWLVSHEQVPWCLDDGRTNVGCCAFPPADHEHNEPRVTSCRFAYLVWWSQHAKLWFQDNLLQDNLIVRTGNRSLHFGCNGIPEQRHVNLRTNFKDSFWGTHAVAINRNCCIMRLAQDNCVFSCHINAQKSAISQRPSDCGNTACNKAACLQLHTLAMPSHDVTHIAWLLLSEQRFLMSDAVKRHR